MIKKYIQENEGRMLEELFSLIRIPSVSAQQAHKPDMLRCAERWKELLLMAGADKAEVMPSDGNPMVYGEKMVDPKAKTVLIYGHYDVMPAEPFELWNSKPFEPEVRDEHIWARGADDDKGQSFIQAKAFEYVAKKIKEVEEKDHVRNFQPPITGEEIMQMFNLKPGREIGILKERVKEAVLEGEIPNEHEAAKELVIQEAKKIGLI